MEWRTVAPGQVAGGKGVGEEERRGGRKEGGRARGRKGLDGVPLYITRPANSRIYKWITAQPSHHH